MLTATKSHTSINEFSIAGVFGLSDDVFLNRFWDKTYLHCRNHELCARMAERLRLSSTDPVRQILQRYKGPAMAIGKPVRALTDDMFDRVFVGREIALDLYNRGCSLELDGAQESFPIVQPGLSALAESFRLTRATFAKAIIYLSQKNTGFPPHFDGYTNVIFQLTGRKRWHLAENTNTHRPTLHYELSELPELPEGLEKIWIGPRDPSNIRFFEIDLRAGDILYLPRGVWHATQAEEPSISLNFTYSIPTLGELKARTYRESLLSDPAERILATQDNSMGRETNTWDIAQTVQAVYRQRLWEHQ